MANFLDLLSAADGKATAADMLLARQHLTDDEVAAIPHCINNDDGSVNLKRLVVLAWVRAKRESSEITLEEVAAKIPATDPAALMKIMYELYYFFTGMTRKDLADMRKAVETAQIAEPIEDDAEPEEATNVENPTPSESSSTTSQ